MEAMRLKDSSGVDIDVWTCSRCKLLSRDQQEAEKCCTCLGCGKPTDHLSCWCEECWQKNEQAKEAEAVSKAQQVDPATYDGPVYNPKIDYYAQSLADGLDMWPDLEYFWACTVSPVVNLVLGEILEEQTQEAPDGFDVDDLDGLEDLEVAVAKFNDLNKDVVKWEPDYGRVIYPARDAEQEEE